MKRYSDEQTCFAKYVIVVPTELDRQELMEAFEYIHDLDIDTDYIAVNQLAHEYLDESREPNMLNNIVVDPVRYKEICDRAI